MAFEDDVFDISFIAGEALTDYQYHFVYLTADNTVKVCSHATTQKPIGILQNKPASGAMARVRIMGVSRVIIGTGTFAFGDYVGSDASGHGIAEDTNLYNYNAVAIMGGAAAEKGTVLLFPVKTISK
jgi:hypothetical protein